MTTERGVVDKYAQSFEACLPCGELGSSPNSTPFQDILDRIAPDVVYLHKFPHLQPFMPALSRVRAVRMVHDHDLCCPTGYKFFRIGGRVCPFKAGWWCWADGGFLNRDPHTRTGFSMKRVGSKLAEMRHNHHLSTILVGSRFMKEELIQNDFSADKIHIVPPIVRLPDVDLSSVPQAPHLLYVGQLIRGKGVDLLLRALSEVKCDFQATIVGTGNARAHLENLSRRFALQDRVQFRGWVKHDDLGPFYRAAKVVAVPSRWPEPFGMVGLEAMTHGRPVVAFDVGGIPDWLEHGVTGLLAPEQDTKALARAIEQLFTDDRLAQKMGLSARRRIIEHFSFERYLDQMEIFLNIA